MAIFLIVPMSIFTAINLITHRQVAMEEVMRNTQRLTWIIAQLINSNMLHGEGKNIRSSLLSLLTKKEIQKLTYFNHSTTKIPAANNPAANSPYLKDIKCSICHQDQNKLLKPMPKKAVIKFADSEHQLFAILPIYNQPSCYTASCHVHNKNQSVLGVMNIQISYQSLDIKIAKWQYMMILTITLLALISFILSYFLTNRLVGVPIKELLRGINLITDGNLNAVIKPGAGEIGKVAKAFNQMQDKLKDTGKQLIISEKLASTGKLAANVAHELNNPLTGILTFGEDLLEEADDHDPKRDDYQLIVRETLRCRNIVRTLLDFSRQEKPHFEEVQVNRVLEMVQQLIKKQASFLNIKLNQNYDANMPGVYADPGQLQQVFLNLFLNASEAMPEGGVITITTKTLWNEYKVLISIGDSGSGIPPEHLEHIFEPFYSTKGGKNNSGLGLAVSWGIVEQHDGQMEVESIPGQGAIFKIFLPIPDTVRRTKTNFILPINNF